MNYFKRILDLRVICIPETMCELLTLSFWDTNWHQAVALVLDWPKEIRLNKMTQWFGNAGSNTVLLGF